MWRHYYLSAGDLVRKVRESGTEAGKLSDKCLVQGTLLSFPSLPPSLLPMLTLLLPLFTSLPPSFPSSLPPSL